MIRCRFVDELIYIYININILFLLLIKIYICIYFSCKILLLIIQSGRHFVVSYTFEHFCLTIYYILYTSGMTENVSTFWHSSTLF